MTEVNDDVVADKNTLLEGSDGVLNVEAAPKYFAVDIDGTFYTRKTNVLLNNIEAFRRATALGNQLFFCTGRTPFAGAPWMPHDFIAKTGYKGYPGVYCNGALVFGDDGSVVSRATFDYEFIKDLLQYIVDSNHHDRFMFFDDSEQYSFASGGTSIKTHGERYDIFYKPTIVTPEQLLQMHKNIVCFSVCSDVMKRGFGKYKNGVDYVAKGDEDVVFDVTPLGVTKALGLKALCKHKGIDPSEVGFIGDGLNDVEIMKQAKVSFAVANAVEEAKREARHVLHETFEEGAFARAMSLVYGL